MMTNGSTASSDFRAARATLQSAGGATTYYRLPFLAERGHADLSRMPMTLKILLENLLRKVGNGVVTDEDVNQLAGWTHDTTEEYEFPFYPARVVLQDFTGVPAAVDLAAMRSAVARLGGNPDKINPLVPAELVIDHSVQVDFFGSTTAFEENVALEYERNRERYTLLRWCQQAFRNFKVVPPGTGIVHQVNLEYLARVVFTSDEDGGRTAYPDTLVGTDSHTTMINGLGVLGWGVGGIEAEAVLLGQPLYLLTPEVVGFRLNGRLPEGATATDLVLTVTQILRKRGVVGKFVEFTGPSLGQLALADRATISNMCPEYGATAALFPVDNETLRYLRLSGRDEQLVDLVERYTKEQGLFYQPGDPEPEFTDLVELDLGTVEPSLAGPRRPQDRVRLADVRENFRTSFAAQILPSSGQSGNASISIVDANRGEVKQVAVETPRTGIPVEVAGQHATIDHGSVAIAAITSCTNTSNPAVMLAAGLLAKKAVERGLSVSPAVKTSLAPGSRVVTDYLTQSGLLPYLEALRFHIVGYGCTTCIGNSGPLPDAVSEAVAEHQLVVSAVLSGNRNFEGRIHPQVRASYLASPPLVVAYALAGSVDMDLANEPLGADPNGQPVYLRDLWPTTQEVQDAMAAAVTPEMFRTQYGRVFEGDERWRGLPVPAEGKLYTWDSSSTYVQEPPFFQGLSPEAGTITEIHGARVLAVLGDSITTDHISPAGSIPRDAPAGQWLIQQGVAPREFNSYGARRGNHEVMMRGTFGNVRLRNELAPGREGDWTTHLPSGEVLRMYDASMLYQKAGTPLLVLAGKEYGSGSSRDWAAKGTALLGVRAVLAESYERIHRSNLVGMGVLPLQFNEGENRATYNLTGRETFDVTGIGDDIEPGQMATVQVTREDGGQLSFQALVRIDAPIEVEYYRHGGILPYVLRLLVKQ